MLDSDQALTCGAASSANYKVMIMDEMFRLISHDVRAGLRAISTLPDWIKEDLRQDNAKVSPDVTHNLALLKRHANRLDQLWVDLRDYARVGLATKPCEFMPLADVISKARSNPLVTVRTEVAGWKVRAPFDDLVYLVHATVENTARHSERQDPTLLIKAEMSGTSFLLSFEDDGVGVPEEYRERCFEFLKKLHSHDERAGSGIGLAACRKIADSIGGRISLADPVNKEGARVLLELQSDCAQNS